MSRGSLGQPPSLATVKSLVATSAGVTQAPAFSSFVPPVTAPNEQFSSLVGPNGSRSAYKQKACTDVAGALSTSAWKVCGYGDLTARRTIVLFGDSNAQMWIPAMDAVGFAQKWRVVAVTLRSCAPYDTAWIPASTRLVGSITEASCVAWRTSVLRLIATNHPRYVLPVGVGPYDNTTNYPSQSDLDKSVASLVTTIRRAGSTPLLLQPVPRYDTSLSSPSSPVTCLLIHPSALPGCDPVAASTSGLLESVAVRDVSLSASVPVLSTAPLVCSDLTCPVVVLDGSKTRLVYRDRDHLSFSYVQWIAAALGELLKAVVGP